MKPRYQMLMMAICIAGSFIMMPIIFATIYLSENGGRPLLMFLTFVPSVIFFVYMSVGYCFRLDDEARQKDKLPE